MVVDDMDSPMAGVQDASFGKMAHFWGTWGKLGGWGMSQGCSGVLAVCVVVLGLWVMVLSLVVELLPTDMSLMTWQLCWLFLGEQGSGVVFKGPVHRTKKKTETGLNWTN
jgi:hypothetical protein